MSTLAPRKSKLLGWRGRVTSGWKLLRLSRPLRGTAQRPSQGRAQKSERAGRSRAMLWVSPSPFRARAGAGSPCAQRDQVVLQFLLTSSRAAQVARGLAGMWCRCRGPGRGWDGGVGGERGALEESSGLWRSLPLAGSGQAGLAGPERARFVLAQRGWGPSEPPSHHVRSPTGSLTHSCLDLGRSKSALRPRPEDPSCPPWALRPPAAQNPLSPPREVLRNFWTHWPPRTVGGQVFPRRAPLPWLPASPSGSLIWQGSPASLVPVPRL